MAKSDNLKKLYEIVESFESQKNQNTGSVTQYKELNDRIDILIHSELEKIEKEKDNKSKLKSCEALFTAIIGILEATKQIV